MNDLIIFGTGIGISILIFFIINNMFHTANFKRKAIFFLIAGTILLVLFGLSHLYDRLYVGLTVFPLKYFIIPIVIALTTILLTVVNLIKGKIYNHHIRSYEKQTQTNNKNHYLYLVYRLDNNYLLKEEDGRYRGDIVKVDKDIIFNEDMVLRHLQKLDFNVSKQEFIGTITNKKRKQMKYFCYIINLETVSDNVKQYAKVDKLDMHRIRAQEFHKNIILRMLIKEKFDITV